MKNKHFLALAAFLCFAFFINSCHHDANEAGQNNETNQEVSAEELIANGKYLVEIMGCNDCHSPKRMGANGPEIIPELMLSGYPADRPVLEFNDPLIKQGFAMFYPDLTAGAGPWGISFAANLTPDDTGIGQWSEEQFKKALTEGKSKGLDNTRTLLPPMPWPNYRNMKDADIHAIFMYLKSINPVDNLVPGPVPPG